MKFLIALFAFMSFSFADIGETVLADLKTQDQKLQELLKSQQQADTPEIQEKLLVLVREIFEFPALAKMALPAEVWEKNPDLNPAYVEAFTNLLEDRFLSSVKGRIADSTEYKEPKEKEDYISIKAYVYSKGKKTKLVYKLKEFDGKYKVFDLMTGASSTLKSYEEQFVKLLEKKSYQELIDLLKDKTAAPKEEE